jgi:hypothetical protein
MTRSCVHVVIASFAADAAPENAEAAGNSSLLAASVAAE